MKPKLLLVDSNYLLHRVMRLKSFQDLETPTGQFIGGIFGFLSLLQAALNQFSTIERLVLVWDGGHSARRMALLPSYKTNRMSPDPVQQAVTEEFMALWGEQQSTLLEIVVHFGVRSVQIVGKEGDDVLGFIANNYADQKIIMSDDHDMLQLCSPTCTIYRPIAKEIVTEADFEVFVKIPLNFYLLFKALSGDKADGIPGIPSVGEATARRVTHEVVTLWGSRPLETEEQWVDLLSIVQQACKNLVTQDARNHKRYSALSESLDTVAFNLALMDLKQEQFVEDEIMQIHNSLNSPARFNQLKVMEICRKYEFGSAIGAWSSFIAPFERLI
jgi:5'-3' exonuclease